MYFIELLLSMNCNQKCYYCDIKEVNEEVKIDVDFLKYSLNCFNTDLMVELCGGEPGLVSNLDDVYKTIYNTKHVKKIQIMSNGLVRLRDFDWLNNVYYNEHLIFDIIDKDIVKFYNLHFDEVKNRKYVIVTTENVVNSIIKNYSFFKDNGFLRDIFWYKIIKKKAFNIENMKTFSKLLNIRLYDPTIKEIELCSMCPPQPAIDFDSKRLLHCAIFPKECKSYELNEKNCLKLMKCEFKDYNICKKCYTIDYNNKIQQIVKCKMGKYINRGYLNV